MLDFMFLLTGVNTQVNPGGTTVITTEAASGGGGSFFESLGQNSLLTIVLYCVFIFGVMYLISVRPRKKEEQKLKEQQAAIKVGDTVALTNGMYGKVTDIYTDVFVVEFGTNRGVRVPVMKSQVMVAKEPNLTNIQIEKPVEEPKQGFLAKLGFGKKS